MKLPGDDPLLLELLPINMFNCPSCQGNSLKIDLRLELLPSDSDETQVQTVECKACGFRGIAVYEESRRGSLKSESVRHGGYEVSDADLELVVSAVRLCPDPYNKHCRCQTHLAWANPQWSVERRMTVKRRFRMNLAG